MASAKLRNACGKFDYDSFLDKAIRHFHVLVGEESGILEKIFIIAGRTQSGKSPCKGVVQSLCGVLKIPLVILTKGVDESIELHAKMVKLADGTVVQERHIVVASNKKDVVRSYQVKDLKIRRALEGKTHGGTLVIADTQAQVVNKACKAIKSYREHIPGGKFVLVVDEVDAMFRTIDRHQKFEQALEQLINMDPSMIVMLSASAVPFMLELVHRGVKSKEDIEFVNLEPQEDYNGIENIQPLEIDGKKVYLEQDEFSSKSKYASDGVEVCCANEKNMALFDDAMSGRGKNVLVLDASCPRVYAKNNIRDKATGVQQLYKKRGKPCIVITFSGRGIAVKFPNTKWDYETWQKKLIGKLLENIDEHYGPDMPVFIFGYTKLCRGISFRSDCRVPTHMIMAMGRGHNISTIVQTLGRVTFNGKSILEANGFECVRVLTTSSDYTVCMKVQNYIDVVALRMKAGDTFAEAVTGANAKIPDSANFLRHTFRELGKIQGQRKQFEDLVEVEDIPVSLSPDEEETKEKFWEDADAQALLRSLARLGKGHPIVEKDDILDDLTEAANYNMTKKVLQALLRKFIDKTLIIKEKVKEKDQQYRVPHISHLIRFMNPAEGELPDFLEDEEEIISSEHTTIPLSQSQSVSSNSTKVPSSGSNDFPTTVDLNNYVDCCTLSSVSMSPPGDVKGAASPNPNMVSPDKSENNMVQMGKSLVGKQVARFFCTEAGGEVEQLHFGFVVNFCSFKNLWSIKYDDGDDEEMDKRELLEAMRRCQGRKHRKPPRLAKASPFLTDISDIPLVREDDQSQRHSCITQHEKKRRVYYTGKGDTPMTISKRLKVDVAQILRDNKRRKGYEKLTKNSQFKYNSPVVLPLEEKRHRACSRKLCNNSNTHGYTSN